MAMYPQGLTMPHMAYRNIRLEKEGRVGIITVARPEKLNAMDEGVKRELLQGLEEWRWEDGTRVVIITGGGDKAFIAGADIQEFAQRSMLEQREVMRAMAFYDSLDLYPKPTIAMINGYCLGGGCELALACDLRIMAAEARIGQPEVNIGIIPGGGGSQRLPRLVGYGQALRLIFTGQQIDAQEALRMGLVEMVVPRAELRAKTLELANAMAEKSPVALRLAKEAVKTALRTGLEEGLRREEAMFLTTFATEDKAEGVRAFLEKRRPEFKGR